MKIEREPKETVEYLLQYRRYDFTWGLLATLYCLSDALFAKKSQVDAHPSNPVRIVKVTTVTKTYEELL